MKAGMGSAEEPIQQESKCVLYKIQAVIHVIVYINLLNMRAANKGNALSHSRVANMQY